MCLYLYVSVYERESCGSGVVWMVVSVIEVLEPLDVDTLEGNFYNTKYYCNSTFPQAQFVACRSYNR